MTNRIYSARCGKCKCEMIRSVEVSILGAEVQSEKLRCPKCKTEVFCEVFRKNRGEN